MQQDIPKQVHVEDWCIAVIVRQGHLVVSVGLVPSLLLIHFDSPGCVVTLLQGTEFTLNQNVLLAL